MYSKQRILGIVVAILFHGWASPGLAEDSRSGNLSKEVQELKATVKKLENLVRQQNEKIQKLEQEHQKTPSGYTVNEGSLDLPKDTLPDSKPDSTAIPPAVASTQPEITDYRQIGPYKIPVEPGSPKRFIPNISLNGIFAGAYFTQDPGESGHNPSRTGFNLQEIELAIQSVIDPYIRADVFLSFFEEGVELEEAYITTLSLPRGLQVKAGQYLLPFGRQNQKHLESWPFVNDMLVNQRLLGPEGFNELGVEVSYLFPTPFYFLLQGNFTQGSNEENFDGTRKQDFAYTGRLSGSGEVAQDVTLLMGASGAFGYNDTGRGNATNLFGGDLLLSWRPSSEIGIDWQTEYIYQRQQVPFGVNSEGGIYSYLLGNWSKRWGAGLRVDYLGLPKGIERIFRLSPIVTFRTTEWFQVRAQYDFSDSDIFGTQHAAFLQWIFTMGPHAPHPF